ncbi:Zn-dependent protease, partial [Mesorhizobium sp. M00.F.Ca.ET.186.01.1.1]
EYHHSAWTSKHFQPHKPFTLLDYLAFEGKAVAFSQLLYPSEDIIDTYPDDEQVESRRAMLQHLDSTQLALQQKIMFGGQDGIPQVFGYSEGYRLVQTFLRDHPDLTVEQWTASSPEELLREVQTSHPEFWR